MRLVIPSRGRSDSIANNALRLFPDATVCVHEDEVEAYGKVTDNLLVHPRNVFGIAPLKNWILSNVKEEIVVIIDDDVYGLYSLAGAFRRWPITCPVTIEAILKTTAQCAIDAGVKVFGFNQTWDPRKYRSFKPLSLNSWVGSVVGIIGRTRRFDPFLTLRADIDFCLQSLLEDRIVWVENRYSFLHRRFEGKGGTAMYRSGKGHEDQMEYLKKKWGKYLTIRDTTSSTPTRRIIIHVEL